jgi:uncharacterized radical SAM superfamily Fe-S cluster-containing enzyme
MPRLLGKGIRAGSALGWKILRPGEEQTAQQDGRQPAWAPGPLPTRANRELPELGFPRETDSLCPKCVIEERGKVLEGACGISEFVANGNSRITATMLEEDGRILMRKSCPKHGSFEDVLSIDPEFSRLQENRYYGRDFRNTDDECVHCHGFSNIKYGRGAVLTIDLTNRCNMMCNPCFANANQVGYVHELSLEQIKKILDSSISFKPRRQMTVQFSGGEPTLSPHFLDALSYARQIGYYSTQAATNGIRFALEPDFAREAREAGLCLVYFQLDGVGNEANSHRHVKNLFDVKLQAIENLHRAGVEIIPVATIINGVNNDQVGALSRFVIDNCDKIDAVSFQPISFTGREEGISDEERAAKRYTTSHLARDLQQWSGGKIDPHRDWFPLGAGYVFTALADRLQDPDAEFGGLSVSCHPDCGSSFFVVANRKTGTWAPLTQFFNLEGFMEDILAVADAAGGKGKTMARTTMSLLRHFDPEKAPDGFGVRQFGQMFKDRISGATVDGQLPKRGDWALVWMGGMWFQDLWTYDFRRTEMCGIPYGTEEGEISFCAYNTGVGWRQIVEHLHASASTADWFKNEGRHKIYAGERPIDLPSQEHTVKVRPSYDNED